MASRPFLTLILAFLLTGGLHQSAMADDKKKTSVTQSIYSSLFSKKRVNASEQKRRRSNYGVMGVRGLDDDPEAPLKENAAPDIDAVYSMEDQVVDSLLVEKIRADIYGQLGNYRSKRLPKPVANNSLSQEEIESEIDLGRKMASQILGANRRFNNPVVEKYVAALTKVVADGGLSSNRPFKVAILDSDKINAFACPGGYIFVTKGALRHSASESQLAALLGHEIAHVSKRHLIASLERKIKSKKPKQTQGLEIDDHAKARRRIKDEDSTQSSEWVRVLGPKGIGVTLLQAASDALDTLLSRGMEADFELEADRLGQQISSASGYESSSLAVLIYSLKNQKRATHSTSASTHPPYDIRLKSINAFVRTLANRDAASAKGSRYFAEAQREWMKK